MRKADPFAETVVLPEDELAKRRRARWVLDPQDRTLRRADETDEEPAPPTVDKPASGS